MLPPVMRFNLPTCIEKMAHAGRVLLGKKRRTVKSTGLAGIERLEGYCRSLGVPVRLREIIPDDAGLPELCRMAANDACLLTNPRTATWEDLLGICEEAW